jgi:hypothetical protein
VTAPPAAAVGTAHHRRRVRALAVAHAGPPTGQPRPRAPTDPMKPLRLLFVLFLSLLVGPVVAQQKPGTTKDDEDVLKIGPVDPYTGGDAAAMAAAGVVAYAPFPWADHHGTADIDKVLGERRILWMETAHFRFGLTLKSAVWPEDPTKRKALVEEVKALRKKLPKLPEKPRRIDPWYRMHLMAQRCEGAYADVQKLLGVTDADFPARGKNPREGAFLGLPDKFLVLLFQKKADMARYMDRFCNRKDESSARVYHDKTHQMLACLSVEGLDGFDEAAIHGHVLYQVVHCLLDGYNGFFYRLPFWLDEGVAHWYSRKAPSDVVNVQILDSEAVAADRQNDWPVKVRRRAQHQGAFFTWAQMSSWAKWEEMGFHAHAQSWSRVDFLIQKDAEKLGVLLRELKKLPPPIGNGGIPIDQMNVRTEQLLAQLFELDGPGFDTAWREWVLKTYPKQ